MVKEGQEGKRSGAIGKMQDKESRNEKGACGKNDGFAKIDIFLHLVSWLTLGIRDIADVAAAVPRHGLS